MGEILREKKPILRARDHAQYIAKDVTPAAGTGDSFHWGLRGSVGVQLADHRMAL